MATPVRTASILNTGGTIDMAGGRGRKRSGGVARLSDTLEETALLLSLIFINYLTTPLVIVSSYCPPEQPDSDAQESFANAITLALDVRAPSLPFVVLGDEIHLASRIEKIGGKIDDTGMPPKYLASYGGPVGNFGKDGIIV